MEDFTIIPYISVHPDRLAITNKVIFDGGRKGRRAKTSINDIINNNRNRISREAEKKIEKAITYLDYISPTKKYFDRAYNYTRKVKLTFVTLTLPARQIHSDQVIRRDCFHYFLTIATRKWNVKRYVMRSERQENGNLHFHLVVPNFIPYQELQDEWNNIINKLGYVDEYRKNMKEWHKLGFKVRKDLLSKWDLKSQKKAYIKGIANNWSTPNSTDIHKLRKIVNVKKYLIKYMAKNEKRNKAQVKRIESPLQYYTKQFDKTVSEGALSFLCSCINVGRLWSCSHDLSGLRGGIDAIDNGIHAELEKLRANKSVKVYAHEYCTVFYFDTGLLEKQGCESLLSLLSDFVVQRFDFHIQKKLQYSA